MKFKEGDQAIVIADLSGHEFNVGERVTITKLYPHENPPNYKCDNGKDHWYLKDAELQLLKDNHFNVWVSSKELKPEYNVSVLVFIPAEDNHCTVGMWDISNKWVLLDEYRVPKSEVTYWREMVELPEDKSYDPNHPSEQSDEMDTTTDIIRDLQKKVYHLEKWNKKMSDELKRLEVENPLR